ncbi:MAG TPA: toll/interleukin-1 receptor domain-containing protein [Methylocella sp.]|nr:toll/interleukin-1 receptor domain-containing protein [Methylocella sp.]
MSSTKDVFISYSHGDRKWAEDLARLMTKRGVSVFSDFDLQPGTEWAEVIRKELEKASALVLLIPSVDVPNRNNIWFEAGAAKALGKRILAVLPPNRRSVDLPSDIADIVDILVLDADKRPLESIAETLTQAIPETDISTN